MTGIRLLACQLRSRRNKEGKEEKIITKQVKENKIEERSGKVNETSHPV